MTFLYHELLFRPLFNLLIFLYSNIPGADFGVAIIVLTLIVRIVFFPLSIKALVSQRELNKLQPKIKELQEKHKGDKQALGQATMQLYKEHKINPLSGCLPILIQLPVLIALYSALNSGLKLESLVGLYSFVDHPEKINQIALGFINLAEKSYLIAILAGVLQWFQMKLATLSQVSNLKNNTNSQMPDMSKQMLYFFPVMVIIIAWNLPTGLTLYWVAATVFSIFEQLYINRKYKTVS
ncbi:MAG: YidC/Oxa1 family membrane protein insertase [Patescibacteria group bacterium]